MSYYQSLKLRIGQNELIKDSFWALLGNFFGKGLSFAAGIYVARFLGKEVFGEYGMIRNTVVSISIFSTFGLGYTVTKFVADLRESKDRNVIQIVNNTNKITWISSGILTLLLIIFADQVALLGLKAAHLSNTLRIVALWVLFNALTTSQIGVLAGLGKFKLMAKWNALIGVITFLSIVALTYYYNLNGALIGLLITQIANWLIYNYLIKKELDFFINVNASNESYDASKLITFSIPVAMQEISYSLLSWLTSFIFLSYSSYSEFGIFNAGLQVSVMILFIPGILRNVFLSHLSVTLNEVESYKKVLRTTIKINLISTLLPVIFILLFLNPIQQMYGPNYANIKLVIILLSINTIPMSVINVYSQSFLSKGKNWILFWIKLIKDLLVIIVFILFVLSKLNASIALSISSIVLNVLFLIFIILLNNKLITKSSIIA